MAVKTNGSYYIARQLVGVGKLLETCSSLAEAKKMVDKANYTAVKNGYTMEQFLITKVEWEMEFTDRGKFKSRSETEKAIQTYPKEQKGDGANEKARHMGGKSRRQNVRNIHRNK